MDELIFILISLDEQGVYGNRESLNDSPGESGRMGRSRLCLCSTWDKCLPVGLGQSPPPCRPPLFLGGKCTCHQGVTQPQGGLCCPSDCLAPGDGHASGRPQLLCHWRELRSSQATLDGWAPGGGEGLGCRGKSAYVFTPSPWPRSTCVCQVVKVWHLSIQH